MLDCLRVYVENLNEPETVKRFFLETVIPVMEQLIADGCSVREAFKVVYVSMGGSLCDLLDA